MQILRKIKGYVGDVEFSQKESLLQAIVTHNHYIPVFISRQANGRQISSNTQRQCNHHYLRDELEALLIYSDNATKEQILTAEARL